MNFFRKAITAALSASIVFGSVMGTASIAAGAEELTDGQAQEIFLTDVVNDDLQNPAETTETAEADIQTQTEAQTEQAQEEITEPSENNEPVYPVFDIYDGYMEFIAQTTTAVTTTSAPKTTTTTTAPPDPGPRDCSGGVKGIDVSKWQGTIDWSKLKAQGIEFAMIQAGYGNLASQEDPMFDYNVQNAHKAGIDCGVYWYSYATTVEDAYREAEVCYQIIKDYKFEYPIMFDIEENSQRDLSTATVSAIIDAFCSRMESKGYFCGVYSYASFLNTKVYKSVLDKYDVWVAHFYVQEPGLDHSYGIWQYTDSGIADGISEYVDFDRAYQDYPYIMKKHHLNGY